MASTINYSAERHILKQYPGEIAEHLASVRSKLTDMQRTEAALLEASVTTSDDLREMFWECALVRYARPFTTGVLPRTDDIQVRKFLSADLYAAHEYILGLRNMHVAHSVNLMELAEPAIVLTDPAATGERRFVAVASLNGRTAPPALKDVSAFLALARRMKTWFDENHRHFSTLAHEEVSHWNIESLYVLPDIAVTSTASPDAVSQARALIHRPAKKARKRS
jgi:hypothetical protein